MKTLVIERETVRRNAAVVKERAGSAVIYAVLTGDGQGAGLVDLAKLLRGEGIGRFAVAEAADAAALADLLCAGLPGQFPAPAARVPTRSAS